MSLQLEIPPSLDGVRADRAVALLAGISRSAAAGLVDSGGVRVEGRPVRDRATPLVAGTMLEVDEITVEPATPPPAPTVPFEVVHADDQLLVVDKPAGVVVHPGAGHRTGTLVSGLLARFPDLAEMTGVGDPTRPGIVHRLDRGTSGLLAVARTPDAYGSLVEQLRRRSVGRRYLALVAGRVAEERGVIDAPLARSARVPQRMAVVSEGKAARTRYEVLVRTETPISATLLALQLESGRTHQIRVHLSAIGHPVVGDDRYGGPGRVGGRLLAPGRLFLHAAELALDHPQSGARLRWESPLPSDLAEVLGN